MPIKYAERALKDLRWYHQYYTEIFPAGSSNAHSHYMKSIRLLLEHPKAGQEIDQRGRRNWPIPKTPFALIYRVRPDGIEILRVWDNRRDHDER